MATVHEEGFLNESVLRSRLKNIEDHMTTITQQLSDIRYTLRTVDRRIKRKDAKEKKIEKAQKAANKILFDNMKFEAERIQQQAHARNLSAEL